MSTCFLFSQGFDEKQCLSMRLSQRGDIEAPLMSRSFDEIKSLQTHAKTILVIPTDCCSLYEVELPLLSDRKARAAIPYALEDQLAQQVTDLHFSFDKQHYKNGHYLVAVMDKSILSALMSQCSTLGLSIDLMTLDWFALKDNEACATERSLLVNDSIFKGALRGDLAALYQKNPAVNAHLYVFKDSLPLVQKKKASLDESSLTWIATRLVDATMMNVCQGELQLKKQHNMTHRWYYAAGVLTLLLVLNSLLMNLLSLHSLHSKIADIDKQIALIYRQFFPQAAQVISPKFRIEQWLKENAAGHGSSTMWVLLEKFGDAFQANQVSLQQLRFQEPVLSVTLLGKNFAALEDLQQRLQQMGVKVSQTQATSHEKDIMATLELSLNTSKGAS